MLSDQVIQQVIEELSDPLDQIRRADLLIAVENLAHASINLLDCAREIAWRPAITKQQSNTN